MTSKADYKPYLTGWRGLSIMLVLAGHFTALPSARWGALGVSFFFALSGRLMGEILFEQRFPVGPFLFRRFSRVWPVLLVFVVVTLALSRVVAFWGPPLTFSAALSALTFTFGYARLWGIGGEQIGHVWSLCIEEHSYLLLLIVGVLTTRDVRKALLLLVVVTIAAIGDGLYRSLILGGDYYDVYWLTDPMLHFITVPVLAYLWRARIIAAVGRFGSYASIALMILAVGLAYHRVPAYVTQTLMPFVLGGAVVLLPLAVRPLLAVLESRPLMLMGAWSYSIYIWQQPFYNMSHEQPNTIRFGLLLLAMLTGLTSYYRVEQPAREFLNKRYASRVSVRRIAKDGPVSISTAAADPR